MSTKREKVVVAMSGGVDSSVAACLLKEQGYDVIGLFMRVGAEEPQPSCPTIELAGKPPVAPDDSYRGNVNQSEPGAQAMGLSHTTSATTPLARAWGSENIQLPHSKENRTDSDHAQVSEKTREHQGCCSASDAADARFVAGMLDIPFFALNFQEDFNEIIDYFADEYAQGRTPNPCVVCNDRLKFGKLVDYADAVGAKYIATGHYARLDRREDRNVMLRGVDHNKDQSYVLFGLNRTVLERIMFPIGGMKKNEVRDIARKYNLPNQDKPDSVEICFVPDRNYARVVKKRRPEAFQEGDVVDTQGNVIGTHKGIGQYTIGQRRGLGIAAGKPIYVTNLNVKNNTVTVGDSDALLCGSLVADRVNKLTGWPDGAFRAQVKIRYLHKAVDATIYPMKAEDSNRGNVNQSEPGAQPTGINCTTSATTPRARAWGSENIPLPHPDVDRNISDHSRVRVVFDEPQRAVTPGQAVVFYDGDVVMGGAWIERAEKAATVQAST